MRGAYRGSDSTLRWVLVGGIVVVVVIATILAISSIFNNGSKKATPTGGTVPAETYCKSPASVHISPKPAAPYKVKIAASPTAKRALIHVERLLRKHSAVSAFDVSRNGRHFVYLNAKNRVVLGTAGKKAKVLKIKVQDVALNGAGTKIVYQSAARGCASLVLKEVGLSGKHPRLLLKSGAFHLANSNAVSSPGALEQDELPNGAILLAHGQQLFAFNPTKHRITPLETASLGQLYSTASSQLTTQPPQFVVAPGLRFAVEAKFAASPALYSLPGWKHQSAALPLALSDLAWSYSGKEMAYPSPVLPPSIKILHVATGKLVTIKLPKRFRAMSLSNVRWSANDKFVAFTGASQDHPGGKLKIFLAKIAAKHPTAHVVHGQAASTTTTLAAAPTPTPTKSATSKHKKHKKSTKKKGTKA